MIEGHPESRLLVREGETFAEPANVTDYKKLYHACSQSYVKDIEEAQKLREDAGRYRHCQKHGFPICGPQWICYSDYGCFAGDTANEAIDAAMNGN